jgi:tRNA pseudouridine55 synthase
MSKRDKNPHHGVLNVNKTADMTSHDVVDAVRRLFRQRRVGHAGTLDPAATGVLLICLGRATRLCEYLVEGEKEYCGAIRLGVATDTYDADGEVVATHDPSGLSREAIAEALQRFVGEIEQKPPAFSAIKLEGVPAYKLARRGEAVDLPTRHVRIASIELLGWEPPLATVKVRCQAGTYMRSLAHDLGELLGVGGHLFNLTRTASGSWRLEEAVTLGAVEAAIRAGEIDRVLHSFDEALRDMPNVVLSEEDVRAITDGRHVHLDVTVHAPLVGAHDSEGRLVAVLAPVTRRRWKPKKVFPR